MNTHAVYRICISQQPSPQRIPPEIYQQFGCRTKRTLRTGNQLTISIYLFCPRQTHHTDKNRPVIPPKLDFPHPTSNESQYHSNRCQRHENDIDDKLGAHDFVGANIVRLHGILLTAERMSIEGYPIRTG